MKGQKPGSCKNGGRSRCFLAEPRFFQIPAIAHTPSLLIPYPFAAEDHQTYNATVFANAGAAKLFQQNALTASALTAEVLNLLGTTPDRVQTLDQMATQTASLAVPDSADLMAALIRKVS